MELTARIVEWNQSRGYGFVELDSGRVFLHIRDFARRQRPEIGDVIRFRMGEDARGRKCAVNAIKIERRGGMGLGSVLVLALLLILPALAVRQITISAKIVTGYAIAITVITWLMYFHDKKQAESGGWRVPESTLHLLQILGGWPSAFVAQRWLRHKTAKASFKIVFWLIVLIHQYVAMDFLQHWKFTSGVIGLIEHSRGR